MNRLLYGSALCTLGLFCFMPHEAQAACDDIGPSPNNVLNYDYITSPEPDFGVYIYSKASTSGGGCNGATTPRDWHATDPYYPWNKDWTGKQKHVLEFSSSGLYAGGPTNQTAYSKASASSSMDISLSLKEEQSGASTPSAEINDFLWFEDDTAISTDTTEVPFELCGNYFSPYYSTYLYNNVAATMGIQFNAQRSTWSKAIDYTLDSYSYDGGSSSVWFGSIHTHDTTSQCLKGEFIINGSRAHYAATSYASLAGTPGWGSQGGNTVSVTEGGFSNNLKITIPIGSNVKCYSSSGEVPGCDKKPPDEPLACGASGDNPIDFALGVKHQTETDYGGGLLSLSRLYRSGAETDTGRMGENWRHSFDRNATITVTPLNTMADITDADGSTTVFKKDLTAGTWSATKENVTSSFEDVFDSTPTHVGYLHTTSNDTREYYDLDGLMVRTEYRGGEALDFTHDGSDRLDNVTNEQGQELEFSYDGSDRVSSVVTPTGTFSYTYDGDNNLSTVTRPDSEARTYHYEDTTFVNALTGITDEESVRFATWAYDDEGRPVSSEHAGGVDDFDVVYNSDGTVTTTNALGKDTIYTFETINGVPMVTNVDGVASANCVAASKEKSYTVEGWLDRETDWSGNVTEYDRDSNGQVTSMIEDVDGSAERTTTTTYDATFRAPNVITETGKTTDYDYDSDGRMTSMTITDTNTSEARTTTYSYYTNTTDVNGNTVLGKLYQVNGPRTDVTDVTTYAYDANSRLETVTNAAGHVTETTSYDSANRPLTVEDANDVETEFVYDSLGRVTSSTVAEGTALEATTSYTYDDNGNVLTITLPNGVVTTNTYDDAQRLEMVEDDIGNTITYTYDDAGNITKEEYKDTSSTLKYTLSKVYDELSRIIENVDANTDSTAFEYDVNGNQTKVIDGNTNETEFAFDGLNRLVETTDALSGTTSYDLNDLDQNEGTTDPRSNETTYSYNAFGDITQEVSPDRGTISYSHDKAGNVTQMTDARSVVTDYSYDEINRLTDIEYPSDSSLDVALTYDSASGCGTSKGRLCSVDDASGTTDYVYDDLGRLTEVTETRGALSFTTEYDYDLAGVLTEITLPSGRVVDYTLNDNGQVSAVAADVNATPTTLASAVSYLPFGPVSSMTYGNSISLSNTHNTAYQLTNRTIGSLMNENFTYDDANNITDKGSDSYTLDDLYRITAENSDSYTYDAIGNRLTKNTDDYTYPSTSSKLNDVEGDGVSYDAAGNITDDTAREYVIDAANRLESIEISSSTVGEYVYNASNQRTSKTVSSVTTHYVYGQGGLLYGEYDSSGNMIREYVYLNGEPIAQIDDVSSSDVVTYLHTDHLGTPRYGTNSGAAQVWAWDSDAFGIGTPTGSVTVNLRFPGQYFDAESELHYNWNRYYNPETGRYIASDPIGLKGGLNTYLYANASPMMFIDFSGLDDCAGWAIAAPLGGEREPAGKSG